LGRVYLILSGAVTTSPPPLLACPGRWRLTLPTSLRGLDIIINNHNKLDTVIAHTLRPVASIHALTVALSPEVLRAAFEKVETFNQ
jgi:glycerol dehydrogenase-like iron-containing ADH family enzyme